MRIFDYQCKKCGHSELDKLVDKWDEEVQCPICNEPMEKLFSGIAIKMDGLGNDHRVPTDVLGGGDVRFGRR